MNKFAQSLNMSFVVEPTHRRRLAKLIVLYGECLTSHVTVSFWFAQFRSGDFSFENGPCGKPQPKVNKDELKAIAESDTSQTTRELASIFGVYISIILDHLRQIKKVKKLDK